MTIKPKEDRIVVLPDDAKTMTPSGLIIPQMAREKPIMGSIIAIGDGKMSALGDLMPVRLSVGQHVLYHKAAGTPIEVGERTYLIMMERDVLAVMEDGEWEVAPELTKEVQLPSGSLHAIISK